MLAQAIAFRRVCDKVGVKDRFGKRRLLKRAVEDFERKIVQFGFNVPVASNDAASQVRDADSK